MADKPKSFEEFYYTILQDICDIEKVVDYVTEHNGNYTPYKRCMFCPECKKAELTFYHKSSKHRAYLKKIPSSDHLEECSYNYDYASKRLITKYVDSLSYDQVQDRLDAIINMLCNPKKQSNSVPANKTNTGNAKDNPILIPDIEKEKSDLKALRRKRLSGWIDESDGTDLHVFYGKVKLQVTEKEKTNDDGEEYNYYLLTLKTLNKKGEWKYRTQIYRGGVKDDIDTNKVYQIALIGNLNFKRKWWQIDLINRNAIRFQEILN